MTTIPALPTTRSIIQGFSPEAMADIPDESVDMVCTSPPYFGRRRYGTPGEIGMEESMEQHIDALCLVFSECDRVLKKTGSMWINYGETIGSDDSHLHVTGAAWRLRFALNDRLKMISIADIIWHRENATPSNTKRRVKQMHEYFFHMVKSESYHFDLDAIRRVHKTPLSKQRLIPDNQKPFLEEDDLPTKRAHIGKADKMNEKFVGQVKGIPPGGRQAFNPKGANPGTVWIINENDRVDWHPAPFPLSLVRPAIASSCPPGGVVLDPFAGSGTTLLAAAELGRGFIGVEPHGPYVEGMKKRLGHYLDGGLLRETA